MFWLEGVHQEGSRRDECSCKSPLQPVPGEPLQGFPIRNFRQHGWVGNGIVQGGLLDLQGMIRESGGERERDEFPKGVHAGASANGGEREEASLQGFR